MSRTMTFTLAGLLIGLSSAASANEATLVVLDASGSMWGQIEGHPKLEIARETLAGALVALPPGTEIGLMAYGHRRRGDCNDIELVVPPSAGSADAINAAVRDMKFQGMTPLSEAVRRAAVALRHSERAARVVLITDGVETCDADPCALGEELAASGVDFTAHVVGFGLSEQEGRQVACLAENTGGAIYRPMTWPRCRRPCGRRWWKRRRHHPCPFRKPRCRRPRRRRSPAQSKSAGRARAMRATTSSCSTRAPPTAPVACCAASA
jgi:hypothetical protein